MKKLDERELWTPAQLLQRKFGHVLPERHEVVDFRTYETALFLQSPLFAMANYFYTEDANRDLVPMMPFVGQALLDVAVESQRRRGLPQRVIEIKPRQIGWTTRNLGRALWTAMHPNRHAIILVDQEAVAESLATRLGTMLNNLPLWLQPKRRINNLRSIVFDHPDPKLRMNDPGLNSSLQITVPGPMRGKTPQFVCVSEFAFMSLERQILIMEGLIGAMALTEFSCVILDTTPNGHDDMYEPMVEEAVENNPRWVSKWYSTKTPPTAAQVYEGIFGEPDHPERGFVPAFCPWYFHEAYTTQNESSKGELRKMTPAQLRELQETLGKMPEYGNDEELELRDKYGVSPYRLWWRRRKIDSYKQPNQRMRILTFHQEYATTHYDCFVDYGLSPFDGECLDTVMRQRREPAARGMLREESPNKIVVDQTFHSDWEELRVYAPPQPGEKYTIGVDCGIAYQSRDADATVAQVVRFRDNKLVATYVARAPVYRVREQVFLLYKWYNNAYTGIETAGPGYDLVRTLVDKGLQNYYAYKRLDRDFPEPSPYPGWETNSKTRPIMEAYFCELIDKRDAEKRPAPDIIIPDGQTLRELSTVRREPSGKIKAPSGHDDCVDALMIAIAIARDPWAGLHLPTEKEEVKDTRAFERMFRNTVGSIGTRNRPNIANL